TPPWIEHTTVTRCRIRSMKLREHCCRKHILSSEMADHDEPIACWQKPEVHPTFCYRALNYVFDDAIGLGSHPGSRVDRERVSTKHSDHAQPVGIESCSARPDGDLEPRVIVKSDVDLGCHLSHKRCVREDAEYSAPCRNHNRAITKSNR